MRHGMKALTTLVLGILLLAPGVQGTPDGNASAEPPGGFAGTVTETTNATRYTYVLVDTGKEKLWAAAPRFSVKTGDQVTVSPGVPMRDFESKALQRTFATVYFSDHIAVAGIKSSSPKSMQEAHSGVKGLSLSTPAASLDYTGLHKPEGGVTVADAYSQKSKLMNKTVLVRGKVVKYNPNIMKRNWLHIKDSAGLEELTITTTNAVKLGDTVLVRGTLATDKDFGYGYKYDVMLENCQVTVEPPAKP